MKYILIIAVFLTSFSCGKKNPYTKKTTGKYLYCKIDGVDYYPEQDPQWNSNKALEANLTDTNRVFSISTYNLKDVDISIGVWDANQISLKSYTLSLNKAYSSSATYDNTPLGSGQYDTDSINLGSIIITKLDKVQKLVEGTFSFKCHNYLTNKTANVTEGEFSLFFNQ
jgi:hypothetical protein